jgi:2Fe-2S type ferredoxin
MAGSAHHEQHRVLSIRGKSYCNSACVFCVEREGHPSSPRVDEVRRLILAGRGKYNMLFFMAGEPSLHPKLFEHVAFAKANGYRYFGMSSHFRAFADPHLSLRILEAGFSFFDISLHAATYEGQLEVNPIGDGGASLKEALHGLRNVMEIARRTGRELGVTHKIVVTRLNCEQLHEIFLSTYRLGVRSYILQPVRTERLEEGLTSRLAMSEDEFMPHVNDLLRRTEQSGATIKLYGMSRIGVEPTSHLVRETNLVRHATRARDPVAAQLPLRGDRLVPERLASGDAPVHEVRLVLPGTGDTTSFRCAEDHFLLDSALASGVSLPFGCRMASCGQCCGRVLEGRVELDEEQLVLTDEQIAAGFVLLCRSSPRSDAVILTHQESALGI